MSEDFRDRSERAQVLCKLSSQEKPREAALERYVKVVTVACSHNGVPV